MENDGELLCFGGRRLVVGNDNDCELYQLGFYCCIPEGRQQRQQ